MMKWISLLFLILLAACVPQAEQKTSCKTGETFQESSRRCIASVVATIAPTTTPSPIQQVPIGLPSSTSFSTTLTEDVTFTATLGYTDANFDTALACVIPSVTNISISTACTCTSGVCTASFVSTANYFGAASFTYYVIDNDGQSTTVTQNITITGSNDTPTVSNQVATFNEDTLTQVNLPYVDIDGDLATSCSIFYTGSNLTFPMGCNCIAGACSAYVLGATNYNGADTFFYRVTANSQTSSYASVTTTLNAVNDNPVGSNATATTTEDTAVTVTLSYTDAESSLATSCVVSNEINLTETTACACAAGVCTVGITPNANLNSSNTAGFSFDYIVNDGALNSAIKTVTVTVNAIDDSPVALTSIVSTSPATPSEDTATTVTLGYSDVDSDLATACTISNVGNGTAGACTCSGASYPNSCSFTYTPTANVNGTNAASFTYTITAGAGTTSPQALAFSMTEVNDTPTLAATADVTDNEANIINISGIAVDEGGGVDENAQTLTITATSDNTTLVPDNQIQINFTEAGDAASSPLSLRITPVAGQYGVANITVTVTDNGAPVKFVTDTFKVTINNSSFVHNGWKNIKAFGPKTNSANTVLENPSVTLEWESFTPTGSASVNGFKVYRATSSGGQDFNSPLPCNSTYNSCNDSSTLSASATQFVDALPSNVAADTTYYYVIRPVDGNGIVSTTIESYSEIKIPVPSSNMALVHRWIANKEICTKMGATPDPDNNFRCTYSGPGNQSGYYDLVTYTGTSSGIYVDRFEAGCNYSKAPYCSGNGCIGTTSPVGTTNITSLPASGVGVYYNRSNGKCYYTTTTGTAGWAELDATFYASYADDIDPMKAHLPPLTHVTKSQASSYCTNQGKRLMFRKEQIAAASWSPNLTSTQITGYETGLALPTNASCNTASGTGLTYTNGQVPTVGNEDSLPGTSSSSIRSVRTASNATAVCNSRYGIQDLVGNVREWTDTTLGSCNVGVDTALAQATGTFDTIVIKSKRYGKIGQQIRIVITSTANLGSETVTLTEQDSATGFTLININLNAATSRQQVYNLLSSNSSITNLIEVSPPTGTATTAFTGVTANLSGTVSDNGAVTAQGTSATLNITLNLAATFCWDGTIVPGAWVAPVSANLILTSTVPGIQGNDLTLSYTASGAGANVVVTNNKNVAASGNALWYYASWAGYNTLTGAVPYNLFTTNISTVCPATHQIALVDSSGVDIPQTNFSGGKGSYCAGTSSDLTGYLSGYKFDGSTTQGNGPGNTSSNITSWLFANTDGNTFGANYFHLALGLPATNNINGDAIAVGTENASSTVLSGDQIDVNIDPKEYIDSTTKYGSSRALAFGGAYSGAYDRATGGQSSTGDKAGRWTADFLNTSLQDKYTGFRCVDDAP